MLRRTPIPSLEYAKQIASSISNPSLEAYKKNGGKVVGYFSPDIPVEILEAAGLLAYDMRGTGALGTEYADAYFRQLTCEFTRTTFNQIMAKEYAFLDGAVVYNCCDHLRRIFDNWKTLEHCPAYHFVYLPKKCDAVTYPIFQEEIDRLIAATEAHFGVKITDESLRKAIDEANTTRALLRELYALRAEPEVRIDGSEVVSVLTAGGSIPRAEYNALLRELIDALKQSEDVVRPRRRLMFLSGHADKPELIEALESQGGIVVMDQAAMGIKFAAVDVDAGGDALEAIKQHYFSKRPHQPRIFGSQDERMGDVLKAIEAYKVDGVISARLTMCDVWAFEQYMLNDLFDEKDIPHLALEVNYILDGLGQIRTRVQALPLIGAVAPKLTSDPHACAGLC